MKRITVALALEALAHSFKSEQPEIELLRGRDRIPELPTIAPETPPEREDKNWRKMPPGQKYRRNKR